MESGSYLKDATACVLQRWLCAFATYDIFPEQVNAAVLFAYISGSTSLNKEQGKHVWNAAWRFHTLIGITR